MNVDVPVLQGLPPTAYTDACHRTGALSVGIIYQSYSFSDANSFVYQAGDGSFPVGTKLVDLAAYFGFDGYFLNVEESLTQEQVQALMTMLNAMQAQAKKQGLSTFYLQWYDAVTTSGSVSYQNELNGSNSGWLANYAGRTLAALSLGFKVNSTVSASAYTIYIGEIAMFSSSPINEAAPTGFTLEDSQISNDGSSAQLRLTWNYDPSVWYYDIYRQPTGGGTRNMIWLGPH